jgi:hypothetical protein
MYRPDKILSCFTGHIGFRDDYDSNIPAIDADLTESRSSRYVTELHELITYENLLLCAKQFSQVTVKPWDNAKAYKLNDIASNGGYIWRALRQSTNVAPVVGNDCT